MSITSIAMTVVKARIVREAGLSLAVSAGLACAMTPATYAAEPAHIVHEMTQMAEAAAPSAFVKKSKSIRGDITIVERDGRRFVQFANNFKAKSGPDLKVLLSPHSVKGASGRNALKGAVRLGALKKTRGVQEYEIPAGVDLAEFGSVLVHCEAYAVLWGGAAV